MRVLCMYVCIIYQIQRLYVYVCMDRLNYVHKLKLSTFSSRKFEIRTVAVDRKCFKRFT